MPVGRILVASVINLAAPEHMVAVGLEVRRECHRILQHRRQMVRLVQFIHTGGGRQNAGQQAHAGRIADRRLAMGVAEQHAAPGQAIDVRRAHLRVAAEAAHPVVQVVNRDEQHVRPLGRRLAKRHRKAKRYKTNKRATGHSISSFSFWRRPAFEKLFCRLRWSSTVSRTARCTAPPAGA